MQLIVQLNCFFNFQQNFRSPFKAVQAVVFPQIRGNVTDRSPGFKRNYLSRQNKLLVNTDTHLPKVTKNFSLTTNRSLMKKRFYSDSDVTVGFDVNNDKY